MRESILRFTLVVIFLSVPGSQYANDNFVAQIDKILHMAPPKLTPTYPAQAPEPERPQSQGLPGVPNISPQPAASRPPVAEKPKARPPTAPKIPEEKLWWKQ